MLISGIQKSSLVDYPGQIACVLFAPGCNYNCYYCHNRSLIEGKLPPLSMDTVLDFLHSRRAVLDAVVLSGGEVTLQQDLIPFIQQIKELGYLIKLDTNGANPQAVAKTLLMRLCDYYAVDYKAPAERYREFCGEEGDAARVQETIRLLSHSGVPFEVRTTLTPQLTELDLIIMARELPPLPRWSLNPYRIPDDFPDRERYRVCVQPYTKNELEGMKKAVREVQPNVI